VNNDLLLKQNESGQLQSFANSIREDVEEHNADQRNRCDKLEAALDAKTRECAHLTSLIRRDSSSSLDNK
jgi:hypothetical protein